MVRKKFNLPLTKGLDSWSNFIELTERRNLLVHCDGIVSSQYISVCRKHGIPLADIPQIGTKLESNNIYITNSYRCLYELGTKLTHVLWRKLLPANLDDSDSSLIEISYNLIHEEDYDLAARILDFSTCTLKKWKSDSNRRVFVINRAQTYYHSGIPEKCKDILNKEDWSSCSDEYQICVAVLLSDYYKAVQIMKRIGNTGPISEADYLDWPVFRDFRLSNEFSTTFEEIFNKKPVNISKIVSEPDIEEIFGEELKEFEELKEEILGKVSD